MPRMFTSGNLTSSGFPASTNVDSATGVADASTYANSIFTAATKARLFRVMRLDGGVTADVITICDTTKTSTGIVLTHTGVATGQPYIWDFGPNGIDFTGGFGVTITSGGTAGLYVYIFDYQKPIA